MMMRAAHLFTSRGMGEAKLSQASFMAAVGSIWEIIQSHASDIFQSSSFNSQAPLLFGLRHP